MFLDSHMSPQLEQLPVCAQKSVHPVGAALLQSPVWVNGALAKEEHRPSLGA